MTEGLNTSDGDDVIQNNPRPTQHRGGRAVFRYPSFVRYLGARLLTVLALQMQSVAVGWQIYEITHSPLALGLTGLAQFLPGILLFLISGHAADRIPRRKLMVACFAGFTICSGALWWISRGGTHSAGPIYAILVALGITRAFSGPAMRALVPLLVPADEFQSGVAWEASMTQTATVLGPAAGGFLYALLRGPAAVYAIAMIIEAVAIFFAIGIQARGPLRPPASLSVESVLTGLRYIWNHKVILGVVTLDLFAVLLGGAVALLPVYAGDILRTGPWGLGLLRSAPGAGAVTMAILLAHKPLRRAGATMLWCVAGFGAFTVVFGLSRSFALSLAALLFVGATDMVSVVTRGTLVQLNTPDEMRGRVNAVEMMFIGASNELGQFESGITADWFGTVPAVVLGGAGALLITALWAWRFPELRKAEPPRVLEMAEP
jgi:MFS family permease